MTQPFVGEVRLFGGNFAPVNWAFCNGQTMSIAENGTLFTLIGTTYGGDGVTTFNLPNLQGRAPVHTGQGPGLTNRIIGQAAGTEGVTLTTTQLPAHTHQLVATTAAATDPAPKNTLLPAKPTALNAKLYTTQTTTPTPTVEPLSTRAISPTGGSQAHENRMPSLAVNYIIALFGIFPTQN